VAVDLGEVVEVSGNEVDAVIEVVKTKVASVGAGDGAASVVAATWDVDVVADGSKGMGVLQ
jgi:hypothetical protein